MPDYLPAYAPGKTITLTAGAAITGGQLVQVATDGRIVPGVLNTTSFIGFAGHDAATAEPVSLHTGGIQDCLASGAITAGDRVTADNNGTVKANAAPATGTIVGVAVTSASGGRVRVQVER